MHPDDALERAQWDLFWLPPEARAVDRPEILYLACPNGDGYLNAVLRVRADEAALPALVAEVDAVHRGVPSRWMLAGASRGPAVERALAAVGYAPTHEHFAYSVDARTFRPRDTPDVVVAAVTDLAGLRDCVGVEARAFQRDPTATPLDDELARCTGPSARVHRFVARDRASGELLASGGLNVYPALGLGLLWAGGTVPEARRRGAYSALVAARVTRARELGLDRVGLYARVGTSAPIVEAQGFTRFGPMTYWERPPRV